MSTTSSARLDALEPPWVARIEAKLDRLLGDRHKLALSRVDRAALGRILPAVVGAWGSAPFTSRDLVDAPEPALRLVLGGRSAKSIGRLLRRAEGHSVAAGYVVQRQGLEINVTLWSVSHG